MKLKELLDVYATPEFDMIDLKDKMHISILRGYIIKDLIEEHSEYLDLDVILFSVIPGGDWSDSVHFLVSVNTIAEDWKGEFEK